MEEIGNYYLNSEIGQSGVSPTMGIPSLSKQKAFIEDTPFKGIKSSGPLTGGFFEGTSKYDTSIGGVEKIIAEDMTTNEARANTQTTLNRIGNALINNAVIAGTTAVSGTLGFVYGIFDAIANGEINKLYDNPVNREMLDWQEATAKAAPLYYTKNYEDSSIWQKLGTDIFWADLIKNLGYAEGMMIPSTGVSKLLQGVPKAAQIIGSSLYGSISEAAIEALSSKQDKLDLDSNIAYNSYLRDIQSDVDANIAGGSYISALETANNDANNAGNFVFGYNVALLTATNALEWGKLFSRGNKFSRRKMLEESRRQGINSVITEGQLPTLTIDKKLTHAAKNIATRFGKSSIEGIEEVMQGVGVTAADLNPSYNDFNEHYYNQDYRELASNTIQSIGMALSEAMKDPETYTNFAMGFFTGALGVPTLQNPKTQNGFRSPIIMEGGIKEYFEEQESYNKKKALVDEVNLRISNNSNFEDYYKGLVRSLLLEDKANISLELNDSFNFNNYQHAQLISDVIMFDNVGHIDILKDIVNKATNFNNDEIQELINQGLFDDGGNSPSIEDAKSKIINNAKKLNGVINNYLLDKELIESQKGDEFSKEALENILYAKSQIKNWQERSNTILDEIYDAYSKISDELITKKEFKVATLSSKKFREDLKTLNKEELTADIAEDLNSKIEDLNRLDKSINSFISKINEYWDSPNKANKIIDDIKAKAVKTAKTKKTKSLKDKMFSIQSVKELREFIENTQDSNINDALNELLKDNNTIVKEYNNINNTKDNIESKIRTSKESEQSIQDALKLLENAFTKVENVSQLQDLNSELYNDLLLLEEEDFDIANNRLVKAKVVLQQAFNNNIKENSENSAVTYDNNIDFSSIGSIELDYPNVFDEKMSVGFESSTKAQPVNNNKEEVIEVPIKDLTYIPSDTSTDSDILKESKINNILEQPSKEEWNPAISEFHRQSIKDGVYKSTAKADNRFKDVWDYLYKRNAFDFVNKGNLKIGDSLYFGLALDSDAENVKKSIFVYTKTDIGYQVLNTLYLSGEEAKLKDKIIEEYNNSEKKEGQTEFISSFTSKVKDLKTGIVVQSQEKLIPLNQSLEGTEITANNMILSVIRGVRKDAGKFKNVQELTLPDDIESKNGWTYLEIPTIRKGISKGRKAMPLFVADYGKQLPINNTSFENTKIYKRIQNAIRDVATASNYEDLKNGFDKLQQDLTTKKLALFITPEGNIRINERLFDSAGKPVINNINGKNVEAQIPHTIYKTNKDGSFKSVETIMSEIDDLLKSLNIRFRTNSNYINTSNYNKELLESGILSSYIIKAEERNAWFTIEPVKIEQHDEIENVLVEQPNNMMERIIVRSSIAGEGEIDFTPREFHKKSNNTWYYSRDARDLDPTRTGIKYFSPIEGKGNVSHITWFPKDSYRSGGATFTFYRPLTTEEFNIAKSIIESGVSKITDLQTKLDEELFSNKQKVINNKEAFENFSLENLMSDFGEIHITEKIDNTYKRPENNNRSDSVDFQILLDSGYSQEDINNMSYAEMQQAKTCIGF